MTLVGEAAADSFIPDYHEIDRETEAALMGEMIAANPELSASDSRYVLATLDGASPYSNVARALERTQFENFFGNDPEVMAGEYGPYEAQSTFFLMVDREKLQPTGVMRIIRPGEAGLKSANDIVSEKSKTADGQPATALTAAEVYGEFGLDPEHTLDVATIASHPDYTHKATGSPVVLASLMRALYKTALQRGDELIAIIDRKPLEQLHKAYLPINTSERIATPFVYLGAEGNTFIHVPIPKVEETVRAADNGATFEYLFGDSELALFGECQVSFIEQ